MAKASKKEASKKKTDLKVKKAIPGKSKSNAPTLQAWERGESIPTAKDESIK